MAKDEKKSPKEVSKTFHDIMKASVSQKQNKPNPDMTIQEKIKAALAKNFGSKQPFATTVQGIVSVVMGEYPDITEDQIKETVRSMGGWRLVGVLNGEAFITPAFFE